MKTQFFTLTKSLFEEADFGTVEANDEGIVVLNFEVLQCTFAYIPALKSALLHCTVGIIEGRKEEYQLLLQMNNLFTETNGATFGVFEDTVSLQMLIPLENISQESYNEQVLRFMEKVNELLPYFDNATGFSEQAKSLVAGKQDTSQEKNLNSMLRV